MENRDNLFSCEQFMDLDYYLLHMAKNFHVVHELIKNHLKISIHFYASVWNLLNNWFQRAGVFSKVTADYSDVTELWWDWIKIILWSLYNTYQKQ